MIIEKTIYIDIDLDTIIASADLTRSSSMEEIKAAVVDYVAGLDDCEYYNINCDDITNICVAVWKAMRPFLRQKKVEEDIDDADIAMRASLGENWW